jgi:hypothetical protein
MARVSPPLPPSLCVALGDDDRPERLQTRIWLVWITLATILVTAWCVSLGPLPAIISLVVAKHVLVAILALAIDIRTAEHRDML